MTAANTGPLETEIRVLAITTSASVQQTLVEFVGREVVLQANAPFWITLGDAAGTVTDPLETAITGGARTKRIEAGQPLPVQVKAATNDGFKVKGVGAGFLRWHPTENL